MNFSYTIDTLNRNNPWDIDRYPSGCTFLRSYISQRKFLSMKIQTFILLSDKKITFKMLGAQRQVLFQVTRGMSQHASRPSQMVDKFVRVDHAGELGADRIYAGQMAVLGENQTFRNNERKFLMKIH